MEVTKEEVSYSYKNNIILELISNKKEDVL